MSKDEQPKVDTRKIPPIRVRRGGVYVPEAFNDGRREETKIRVNYAFLSFEERQQLFQTRPKKDDPESVEVYMPPNADLIAMIDKGGGIENLAVEDEGEIVEVTSASELFRYPGLEDLAVEVYTALRRESSIDPKNSKSPSASG